MRKHTKSAAILVAVLTIALLALVGSGLAQPTQQAASITGPKPPPGCAKFVTLPEFRPFSRAVWALEKWDRGMPPHKVIAAERKMLRCSQGPGHRKAMKHRWRADQIAYFDHRQDELWRVRVTPFYGCTKLGICKWWAIPAHYVSCESGGDYYPDAGLIYGGAYGIIPSTWADYGGTRYGATAYHASPKEQDLIAAHMWDDVHDAAWAPFEPPGCG